MPLWRQSGQRENICILGDCWATEFPITILTPDSLFCEIITPFSISALLVYSLQPKAVSMIQNSKETDWTVLSFSGISTKLHICNISLDRILGKNTSFSPNTWLPKLWAICLLWKVFVWACGFGSTGGHPYKTFWKGFPPRKLQKKLLLAHTGCFS